MRNACSNKTFKIVSYCPGVAGGTTNISSRASGLLPRTEAKSIVSQDGDAVEEVSREYVRITGASGHWLEQDGLPENVLSQLYLLKDRRFYSAETFRQARDDTNGAVQLTAYHKSIERSAHVTGRVWSVLIDSTHFNRIGIDSFAQDSAQITCYRPPFSRDRDPRRRGILEGVDGVIVVADSQIARMEAHVEMIEAGGLHLQRYGRTLSSLPWVIQDNTREVPHIASIEMGEARLNQHHVPYVEVIAVRQTEMFNYPSLSWARLPYF